VSVIGGAAAGFAYPYLSVIVAQMTSGSALCSGSKISARWVLTAAHCVTNDDGTVLPPSSFFVAVGNASFAARSDWVHVLRVVRYATYDPTFGTGDVALLQLDRWEHAWSVELAGAAQEPALPATATIAGFGLVAQNPDVRPDTAQAGTTVIREPSLCASVWSPFFDAASELCAGPFTSTPPAASCHGDSGGPLLVNAQLVDWTLGVVDYGGAGCADVPAVYARVSAYRGWILGTTGIQALRIAALHQTGALAESSATAAVTEQGGGADTLLALASGTGSVKDATWVEGEGPVTGTLHVSGLYAGSSYTFYAMANNEYTHTAWTPVTLETADLHRPSVSVRAVAARRGRLVRIPVVARDNSPWLGYSFWISRPGRTFLRVTRRIGAAPNTKLAISRSESWRVPRRARGVIRACARAFDGSGHLSPTVCKKLRLTG
jgi:hypothetical protein